MVTSDANYRPVCQTFFLLEKQMRNGFLLLNTWGRPNVWTWSNLLQRVLVEGLLNELHVESPKPQLENYEILYPYKQKSVTNPILVRNLHLWI